jgi:hypothetical protein
MILCILSLLLLWLSLQENPDLFKWLTGQQQPPQELQQNPAYMVRTKFKPSCWRVCNISNQQLNVFSKSLDQGVLPPAKGV